MRTITPSTVLLASFLVAAGGCQQHSGPAAGAPAEADFPIVRLTYDNRVEDVILIADYGYIVDWPADRTPVFYVFDKTRCTRARTNTWETFVAELRKVPDGSEIDEVSKCTVPFAWGMPDGKREELTRILSEKALKTVALHDTGRHAFFCYCEATQMTVLVGPAH